MHRNLPVYVILRFRWLDGVRLAIDRSWVRLPVESQSSKKNCDRLWSVHR